MSTSLSTSTKLVIDLGDSLKKVNAISIPPFTEPSSTKDQKNKREDLISSPIFHEHSEHLDFSDQCEDINHVIDRVQTTPKPDKLPDALTHLRRYQTWLGLSDSPVNNKLELFANEMVLENYKSNTIIYNQHEIRDYIYIIATGEVELRYSKDNIPLLGVTRTKDPNLRRDDPLYSFKPAWRQAHLNKCPQAYSHKVSDHVDLADIDVYPGSLSPMKPQYFRVHF